MTTTESPQQGVRNLDFLTQTEQGLTLAQRTSMANHLLGGIASFVPVDKWDEAVERALAFTLRWNHVCTPDCDPGNCEVQHHEHFGA